MWYYLMAGEGLGLYLKVVGNAQRIVNALRFYEWSWVLRKVLVGKIYRWSASLATTQQQK